MSGTTQPPDEQTDAERRVSAALAELERQGIAECVDGQWQLTELGRQRRDSRKVP